ncbi:hypothetical protein [Aureitalea marina]|uniref:Uncharacterized protein n=1 Tax=Aureitalea marina TaxID=930804 RepID=A0A2S7KT75_9FLAO|nr:hypothetical protein [Aureitalea marina]PQB05788.1 hypothetical protein BST85_13450 [Aureitalea marina]
MKSKKEVKEYGFIMQNSDSSSVSVHISDFNSYGDFLQRLQDITCDDSIPRVVLESDKKTKHIYPLEYCDNAPFFHPRFRNTFFVQKDRIVKNECLVEYHDLKYSLNANFENFGKDPDLAESPDKVLFIFEIYENQGIEGIENHLEIITESYDSLRTKNGLKILFWPKIDVITEPEHKN